MCLNPFKNGKAFPLPPSSFQPSWPISPFSLSLFLLFTRPKSPLPLAQFPAQTATLSCPSLSPMHRPRPSGASSTSSWTLARARTPNLYKRRIAPWEPLSYPRRRLLLQTLAPKSPPPLELHTSSGRHRCTAVPPHPCSFLPPPKLRRRVSEVEPLFSPLILLSSARFSSPELRRSTSTSSAPSAAMAPLLKP